MNPQAARVEEWSTPHVQLLGVLIDQNSGYSEGYVPILQRVLAPEQKKTEVVKKPLTAAEIRKRVLG
ncbi:hypothetical protein BHF78_08765 [Corynebacterium diphtheriae]|nr:hypothetical protein BHF76_01885 [Corynebacterium diphtheriae]OIR65379.1 hypothetical protein BHF77_10770 [Corynebacterium diphtheriae]OIR73387.1 hypothetical protein BHF78_08765 [Corynebacterium diphtheriae]OIR77087.1 hypothetical protein BHF83_04340 [Corynebacterium diphtheriae]OIR81940.1 hypothetical protein BHF81_03630 [Corynebacterium diphtheriae]